MCAAVMWTCDFGSCGKPSVRTYGECVLCDRHLCAKHLRSEYHKCPKWEDEKLYFPAAREAERKEITSLFNRINVPALLYQASSLRGGILCYLAQPLEYDHSIRSSVMGGMNYHIEVQFEDGISSLARIRRYNATSPPPDLRAHIMRSEVATLQFLSKTKLPVPKVFDYNLDGENLMEKMAGHSLCWSLLPAEQRKKIMSQLADIHIELRRFPLDSMGSLGRPGTENVGPFARVSLTDYHNSYMAPLGPFTSGNIFSRPFN